MILINKVTTFASETFQKDLIECISHNIDINSISTIVVFHNNSNIVLPKHDKVKLIIKNKYTDKDIIEYCKKITTDDIFIFSNPFIKFNNTLNNLEKPISTVNKIGNDCFIFNRNEKIIGDSIEDIFQITTQNNKITVNRKHLWTKEIKIQSLVNKQVSTPLTKIDVVIVSVDYNDFLSITINSIVNLFNITVVTSPNDITCQELCKKYGVNCVITERMYENGAIFNKGKAINEGLKSIKNPDWILLLDADIYLKPDFLDVVKNSNLNINSLVMCKRLIIDNGEDFTKWKNGENVGQLERSKGYGYFQMFNANCQSNRKFFYSEEYTDASESDLEFRDRFKIKSELDTYVVHLGDTGQNWSGRVTEKFIKSNEWGVVNEYNIEKSKYGKLKIINSTTFKYHNGGWLSSLRELKNINNVNGIKFDCFLESNFCWNGSKCEPYKEDWIGILHNPIDSPKWYMEKVKNVEIFESKKFKESLLSCKGLYVLSDYEKLKVENKLSELKLNIKVNSIKHTSPNVENKWSFNKYKNDKKILHIGWWLRDIGSFYDIKTSKNKIRIKINQKIEDQINQIFEIKNNDVTELEYLNNKDYEDLISSSIVYIKLVDSVANNTILECIKRSVPILVNRNPSVEEYLGVNYPLYFDDDSNIDILTSDKNIIKAHNYLSEIKKDLNMSKQIEKSSIYKNIESELNIETLFEPNDLENSNGGVYNPGFLKFNNKRYVISRVENLTENERGTDEMWIKSTSVPHITELDENLNIVKSIKLNVIGDYKRVEDFRLFQHKNKLYSNHILIGADRKIYPVVSEINLEQKTLSIIGKVNIDIELKNVEKNWIFFEKEEKLYLIYSLNPMIVYEVFLEDLSSKKVKNQIFDIDWTKEGYLSSSTNPIKVSNDRYIMGIHSRDRNKIYHQGFLVFDNNFNIINCSKEPYLSGGDFDGINKNVIYTSAITLEENLICFAGDGDIKTILIEFKNNIWKELL
jgi:predicted GH43/DUF377 family glycosyl hydrolase